jgi:hypothetical protein
MSAWTPIPKCDTPIMGAIARELNDKYKKMVDYYNEGHMDAPFVSPTLLDELKRVSTTAAPKLAKLGVLTSEQIMQRLVEYGPRFSALSQNAQTRGYDFWSAISVISSLSRVEHEILNVIEFKKHEAAESWKPLKDKVSSKDFSWGKYDVRNNDRYIGICAAKIQLIEERLPSITQTTDTTSLLSRIQTLEERQLAMISADSAKLTELQDRLLAVGVVAAHAALLKDRVAALETENQGLKCRLATLEAIILGTK